MDLQSSKMGGICLPRGVSPFSSIQEQVKDQGNKVSTGPIRA